LYGTPEKVDMVDAMLLQKLDPEYDRAMFERVKQVQDEEVTHGESKATQRSILWTFDAIKWYSEMDAYKDSIFEWVNEMLDAEADHERNWTLAVEFCRIGEEDNDNENDRTDLADFRLNVVRSIDLPTNFEWRT
jgi:hypothetical protein